MYVSLKLILFYPGFIYIILGMIKTIQNVKITKI
jgi:hypothetical protein